MKSEYRKYNIVMLLCLLVGGFSLILFLFQSYDSFWRGENFSRFENNLTELRPGFELNRSLGRMPTNPEAFFTSPFSIMLLVNGIILIIGGLALWSLTREKELRSTKEKLTSLLLLPEERAIILELKKSKGSLTQSQLVRNTGLSKVKMHRIVGRLAAKGIIKKYPYGLTNKIVLEKEV